MNILLLGGNSIKNKVWIDKVAETIRPFFETVVVHQYEHWTKGQELIDFNKEIQALRKLDTTKEWCIFAKSAGTLLSMIAFKEGVLKPSKSIFVGTAVNWGREMKIDVDALIKHYSVPTFFIQQTSDPAFSYAELKQLLETYKVVPAELLEVTGDTHNYDDYMLLSNTIRRFFLES